MPFGFQKRVITLAQEIFVGSSIGFKQDLDSRSGRENTHVTRQADKVSDSGADLFGFLRDQLWQLGMQPPAVSEGKPITFQVGRDRFGMVITFSAEAYVEMRHYLELVFSQPTFEHETTSIFRAQGRGITAMMNCVGETADVIVLVARDPAIAAEAIEQVCEAVQRVINDELAKTLQEAAQALGDVEARRTEAS